MNNIITKWLHLFLAWMTLVLSYNSPNIDQQLFF